MNPVHAVRYSLLVLLRNSEHLSPSALAYLFEVFVWPPSEH